MPSKVPAPSKGALRTLRHIALGTSCCTVAFSMAIITEERRRRIRTAQKIIENGKKLRTCNRHRRQHSSAATIAIKEAEEEAIRIGNSHRTSSSDAPRVFDISWSELPPVVKGEVADLAPKTNCQNNRDQLDRRHQVEEEMATREKELNGIHMVKDRSKDSWTKPRYSTTNGDSPPKIRPQALPDLPAINPMARIKGSFPAHHQSVQAGSNPASLQSILAEFFQRKLDGIDMNDIQAVKSVVKDYLQCFSKRKRLWRLKRSVIVAMLGRQEQDRIKRDDLIGSRLSDALLKTSQKLCYACINHQMMASAAEIIDLLIQWPMSEERFMSFRPQVILEHITSSFRKGGEGSERLFNRTVRIFCVQFRQFSMTSYPEMAAIGERLCAVALHAEDYELVHKIYERSQAWCLEKIVAGMGSMIWAQHKLGQQQALDDSFERFSTSAPNRSIFLEAIPAFLKCAQSSRTLKEIEEKTESILQVAIDLAMKGGYFLCNSWFQTYLSNHWRLTRDFQSSQALFDRLEKDVDKLKRPVALYRTMMRICVEADRLDEIQQYFDRPVAEEFPFDIEVRSTLAQVKAMSDDWDGVEEELNQTKNLVTDKWTRKAFSSCFVPILKLYAKGHDVTQTEEFLQKCTGSYGIVLNQLICNIMLGVYSDANEFDSIPKWVEYTQSHGFPLTASSFNHMLSSLAKQRNHAKLYRIYEKVEQCDKSLVNQVTLRILESSIANEVTDRFLGEEGMEKRRSRIPEIPREDLSIDANGVLYAMKIAMSKQDYHDAYNIYRDAKADHIYLHRSALEVAMEAIRGIGGQDVEGEIACLLSEAQGDGQDIKWALPRYIVWRVRKNGIFAREIDKIVREAQARLWAKGISLDSHVVTEAVAILFQRGEFRQALDLWSSLNRHRAPSLGPYTIDLPILTILLKIYIKVFDIDGIRWVVKTLVDSGIRTDTQFRNEVKFAIKALDIRREIEGEDLEYLNVMRPVLVECLAFAHEFAVERKVQERRKTERLVVNIMRGAVRDLGGEEVVSDDEEGGEIEVVPVREVADSELEERPDEAVSATNEMGQEEETLSETAATINEQLEEPQQPLSLLEYYSKARSLALVAVPTGS